MFNSIAYSQITGIQTETKKEIVKTLLDYPLVLEELKVEKNKTKTLESIVIDEREKISIYESIIKNKDLEINNYKEQKKEYEKQLKKNQSGFYIYGSAPINADALSPEIGVLFQLRNKMFISTSAQYNNLNNNVDLKVGIGVKLF